MSSVKLTFRRQIMLESLKDENCTRSTKDFGHKFTVRSKYNDFGRSIPLHDFCAVSPETDLAKLVENIGFPHKHA